MNLKNLNKIILLIVLFLMIGMVSVNASVERVLDFTFAHETYANSYNDLKEAFGTDANKLREHFANYGVKEGRVASPVFDVTYYVAKYSDLQQAYGNDYEKAYNHFLNYGIKEGRVTSPVFDVTYYVAQYKDLQQAYGNDYEKAFNHFVNYGMAEGRKTSANFDVVYYVSRYADLQNAYGKDYEKAFNHYLNYGMAEKRVTVAPAQQKPTTPVEPEKPEHKHSYVPTFEFAEDNKTCKITLVCSEDASHKETFVVDTTSEVKVQADCETVGSVEYTATKEFDGVKYSKIKTVEVKAAHNFSEVKAVKGKEATCEKAGKEYHVCSKCEALEKNEDGTVKEFDAPKKDHEWQKDATGKEVVVNERKEATCTLDAYITRHCTLCGKDVSEKTADRTGHNYVLDGEVKWPETLTDVTKAPKATAKVICKNEKNAKAVNATVKVELTSSKAATCAEDGEYVYTASVEYTDSEGKKYEFPAVSKTYTTEATNHPNKNVVTKTLENKDVEVTTTCPACGLNETTIEHTKSSKDPVRTIKTATCTEKGVAEYLCAHCDQTFTEEIEKTTHALVEEVAVAPVCKEDKDGNYQYWKCTTCNQYFMNDKNGDKQEVTIDDTVNPAKHTLKVVAEKEKTCVADGNIEYWQCSTCKRYFRDAEATDECEKADTVVAKGHDIQFVPASVATCEEEGNKEHYKCTAEACGKLFLDENAEVETTKNDVTIAQKAHDFEEHAAVAPICTEAGMKKHYTCKTCSNYFTSNSKNAKPVKQETLVVKALGAPHSLTHVVAKEATCTADGNVEYWECSKCNTKFTAERATQADVIADKDAILPMGHKFIIVGTKAECEYANIYCSACKAHGTATKPVSAETLIPADVDKTDKKAFEKAAKEVFGEDYANYIPSRAHDIFEKEVTEKGKTYIIEHCNICNKDLSKTEKN